MYPQRDRVQKRTTPHHCQISSPKSPREKGRSAPKPLNGCLSVLSLVAHTSSRQLRTDQNLNVVFIIRNGEKHEKVDNSTYNPTKNSNVESRLSPSQESDERRHKDRTKTWLFFKKQWVSKTGTRVLLCKGFAAHLVQNHQKY